jgi:hypothetical protein
MKDVDHDSNLPQTNVIRMSEAPPKKKITRKRVGKKRENKT